MTDDTAEEEMVEHALQDTDEVTVVRGRGTDAQLCVCHTRFSEENQVLAICMPGSSFIHIVTS
jgi:hypothetical protein